jgi:hypothetical protein
MHKYAVRGILALFNAKVLIYTIVFWKESNTTYKVYSVTLTRFIPQYGNNFFSNPVFLYENE